MGVVALGCAVISIVFCIILNETARFYGRFFSNKYARVVAGAVLVIFITLILGTTDYMGAGAELIEKAVETGDTDYMAFFWKNAPYRTDYEGWFSRRRNRSVFLRRRHFRMHGRTADRAFSLPLRSLRNGGCFLWCDELPDYFYSDCL